ncbi:DUF916 and DUF3324 domain-containing protein [Carnobacterium maltaromaticum]|uniref:DUF916 and DUF3324 domain-containing protein n=1 Tax=Carnobacterium maltaromaticum TaxID=2751 RepID=A0AAW9KA96_CARML|nr:DUF916 and DUF3324 domain-containing protein [Carnobacterium maltaromaticum]MDZ5760707.1 DUF916 and DUF3324 domain-containing protein [Carnobacterium maltaromaticum]
MKKIIILATIILFGFVLYPTTGQTSEGNMAYSVKANIPENQINKAITYFDLKMEPNQKQEISLTVNNSSDQKTTLLISPNVAVTNQNGVIDYSQPKGKLDSSLKIPLTNIISPSQEVDLEPNQTKKVIFTLQMPEKKFEGTILGGFYITKKEDMNKDKSKEETVQIKNKYSYVIGIQIRENTNTIKPVLKLNQIKPALLNYRTAVTVNLQNTESTLIKELDIDAKVMKKDTSTILHETNKKNLSMAPNSNFDFPINWDNQELESGKYTLELVARTNKENWKFKQDFEISAKSSKDLNKEAVELEKKEPNWIMIIGITIGGLLLIIILIAYYIYRYHKKKEYEKRARQLRRRKQKKQQEIRKKNSSKQLKSNSRTRR